MRINETLANEITQLIHNGVTCREAARLKGIHRTTVERLLKRLGIGVPKGPRPIPCDSHFFSTFRSDSCYWAGMMLADGNVHKSRPQFSLGLKLDDIEHVEKFAAAIKYEGEVHSYTFVDHGRTIDRARVEITNKQVVGDLRVNFSIVPQKTPIATFPHQVPKSLWSHLVRGIFDGDGCISYPKDNVPVISFVGTHALLEGIRCAITQCVAVTLEPPVIDLTEITSCVGYSGDNAKRICDWMYEESTVETRLDRKYGRYLAWLADRPIKRQGNWRVREGACAICGTVFTRNHFRTTPERTTCSPKCRNKMVAKIRRERGDFDPLVGRERPEWKAEFVEVLSEAAKDINRTAALKRLSLAAVEAGLYDRNVIPEGGQDE